jgi:hypothetical protein
MARTSIELHASQAEAWTALQNLETWEGVAGIEDLREPQHDSTGNLIGFRFAMDTAVGRVNGRARVEPRKPGMTIRAEQKGLELTIQIVVTETGSDSSSAIVDAHSLATSFLSKPLSMTLNAVLDNAIDGEAAKIAGRIGGWSPNN